MNIFDNLTEKDKELIDDYIWHYAFGNADLKESSPRAALETLLTPWATNKEKLYHIFGDKFILEKEVVFSMSHDELGRQMMSHRFDYHSPIYVFTNDLIAAMLGDSVMARTLVYYEIYQTLRDENCFVDNVYNGENVSISFPDEEKTFFFKKGMKLTKALKKLAIHYHLDEKYEAFRIAHSQILNQKKMVGTLCLSIHPLDYMTMSDNGYNWKSCMNWMDDGEYRQGTVEMMNSNNTVVAYFKGNDKWTSFEWNNKKWRTLFVADPKVICSIKGYPYQHDEFNGICADWLAELMNQTTDCDFEIGKHYKFNGRKILDYERPDGFPQEIMFTTNYMYNDFGRLPENNYHTLMFNRNNLLSKDWEEIVYSGPSECMWCGYTDINLPNFNDDECPEHYLVCENCVSYNCCDNCGALLNNEEDTYYVDDITLCEDCYWDRTMPDIFTDERHLTENMIKMYIVPGELIQSFNSEKYPSWAILDSVRNYPYGYVYNLPVRNMSVKRFFNCDSIDDVDMYKDYSFILLNVENMTEYLFNSFNEYSNVYYKSLNELKENIYEIYE